MNIFTKFKWLFPTRIRFYELKILQKLKQNSLLKSFRFKILIVIVLAIAIALLLIIKYIVIPNNFSSKKSNLNSSGNDVLNVNYDFLKERFDKNIDSILYTFSIKKEWITTTDASDKVIKQNKSKQEKTKPTVNVKWFNKEILIPKDLTSAEVNMDISDYINSFGLMTFVNEDIKTKDISMLIFPANDSSMTSTPLARINITHSDKVQRENGTFVIILNNIWEYKPDDIDKMLESMSEFSFIFPRKLEQIDLQNKLVQMKKDLLINLTIGEKDKPEFDFNIGMEDKDIKQRVKSFASDFPYIKTVLLSRADPSLPKDKIFPQLNNELTRYDIKTIPDTAVLILNTKDDAGKNKVPAIINLMKSKIQNKGLLYGIVSLSYDELISFYEQVSILKKAGYKFLSVSQYFTKEDERKKKELLKQDMNIKKNVNSKKEKK